jgi:aryl-alcohol dehydrogenase-like predicted oxidoreductase
MDTLDTAIAYGASEACLGEIGVEQWRVITKLPRMPSDVASVSGWFEAQLAGALERLKVQRLEALLLHHPTDMSGPHGKEYLQALQATKRAGTVRAIGVSIYDPRELDALWPVWRPDLVQAPFNVLDRRLQKSGWLAKLADHGVRVHTRSAFLQGLLLMSAASRPAWFAKWGALLARWCEWCKQHDVSPLAVALAFARSEPHVERVVVGVDSEAQLAEIIAASATLVPAPPQDLYSEDLELIEPSRWKLK